MTIEQRVAVLEEIFSKLQDYYMSGYSGEEIDALLASAGVPIGIIKEYDSVSAMNDDFSSTDVTRGQFVLILTTDTSSEDYGKVYLKGSANWVYVFTLTSLTAIKGPQGPAGKRGAKGADGADGKNFMVLGYYETLSALNAAVPSPGTGDTYGVGTEPPYAFYMYDPTISNWRYVGNLQGPAGSQGEKGDKGDTGATGPQGPEGPVGGSSNFVRYDAAQTLTDAQKTQARGNIAAAPDGYGLGSNIVYAPSNSDGAADANLIDATGFYLAIANAGSGGWNYVFHMQYPSDAALQFGSFVNDTTYQLRKKLFGVWQPWEWVNPPMQLGVEYRTTERYLGKPVYAKTVQAFSSLTGSDATDVCEVSVDNADKCISCTGETASNWSLPSDVIGGANNHIYIGAVVQDANTIKIMARTDRSDWSAAIRVTIKYTKTTD